MFNIGPPKQADKAMTGYPKRATVISATKSPKELPTAKMVSPRIASDMPKITPNALSTPTTSFAMVDIHAIATTKPKKHSTGLYLGASLELVVRSNIANETIEPSNE
jgi:hypothetical protein